MTRNNVAAVLAVLAGILAVLVLMDVRNPAQVLAGAVLALSVAVVVVSA